MGENQQLHSIGTSVVLFDDGLCGILSQNDHSEFDGHCVFFKNRCLISIDYVRNRIVDLAYRIDGYLLYLKYNDQSKL